MSRKKEDPFADVVDASFQADKAQREADKLLRQGQRQRVKDAEMAVCAARALMAMEAKRRALGVERVHFKRLQMCSMAGCASTDFQALVEAFDDMADVGLGYDGSTRRGATGNRHAKVGWYIGPKGCETSRINQKGAAAIGQVAHANAVIDRLDIAGKLDKALESMTPVEARRVRAVVEARAPMNLPKVSSATQRLLEAKSARDAFVLDSMASTKKKSVSPTKRERRSDP